tara:strand:+ start:276 stop:503 length:228 start_codon:yes stop_codon:yes gene_type:complete
MNIYIYKTRFTNGRDDFLDVICADNQADAERLATAICRGISDDLSCDEWAEVEVVGEAATDAASFADEILEMENA